MVKGGAVAPLGSSHSSQVQEQAGAEPAVGAAPSLPLPGQNPRQLQEDSEEDLKHIQESAE